MKKYMLVSVLSFFFLLSCGVLSNRADKTAKHPSESGTGKIIETLVSRKKVVTQATAEAIKLTKLEVGSVIDVDMDPADLEGITYEYQDVYTIRCLEGGTMPCQTLDWTLCPSSGCPTPSRVGAK